MTVKIVLAKGRRNIVGGKIQQTAQKSLSQTIEAKVREDFVKDGSTAKAVADAQRLKLQALARGYYMATIQGCMELVDNSGIDAAWELPAYVDNPRPQVFRRRDQVLGRGRSFTDRGKVSVTISTSQVVQEGGSVFDLVKLSKIKGLQKAGRLEQYSIVTESVHIPQTWTRLSWEYARRKPKSKRFYRKRTGPESARLAFLAKGKQWLAKAKRLRNKRAITVVRVNAKTGSVTYRFQLDYPSLDGGFDFIREAFVLARKYGINYPTLPSGKLDREGAAGIAYAEGMRPMLRPYAIAMGKRYRDMLSSLK